MASFWSGLSSGPGNSGGGSFTSPWLGPNGSVSAPTYSFSSSTSTGIYSPASNQFAVTTNGIQALLIDASQNTTFAGQLKMSATTPVLNATAPSGQTLLQVQNNGTAVASLDKGGMHVPSVVDTSTYYSSFDWDTLPSATSYSQNGNFVPQAGANALAAGLVTLGVVGAGYVNTSSTTAGGYASIGWYSIIKSAAITWQIRQVFYMPPTSTSANRYTAFVGGCIFTGTANNTLTGAVQGPYIKYSDNLNSGNWVMGSAVNSTQTTANSSTAPTFSAVNTLVMTLANGVWTFVVNGVTIGTVTDANIGTGAAVNQGCSLGGMAMIPDGTNFTTAEYLFLDRSDIYVTGLSR